MNARLLILGTIALPLATRATLWQVGPGLTYTMPSQVSALVQSGDTVDIVAGNYPSDVCAWTASDLLIRGVGGLAEMESNGMAWGDKAIWVIQGDRTTVEWIAFSECAVPDLNGAGIRQEGHDLIVRHCVFHDNENGILAGEVHPSTIRIEYSEFAHNGHGDGYSHNLYIGRVDSLIFRFNYSHHAHVGHELKSRAWVNVIEYNRLSNEATGDASREIDLPDGGQAYVIGNVVQQGLQGQNSNMIGYGLESLGNPGPHELYAINNTMVNERNNGSFFSVSASAAVFKAWNNILAGGGTFASGGLPISTDTMSIRFGTIASFGFQDAAQYDYHISEGSPADGVGIPSGLATSGYPLVAWSEYVHPSNGMVRCQQATLDAGAFETCTVGITDRSAAPVFAMYPNPAKDHVRCDLPFAGTLVLSDASGRTVISIRGQRGSFDLDLSGLVAGVYVCTLRGPEGMKTGQLVVE